MSEFVTIVTEETFENEVLQADKPVLVDFWAEWCGPCKMFAPVLEETANEYSDKVKMAKANVDETPNLAQKYGVRGIPTVILFKNGEVVSTNVGALNKSALIAFLDSNI